MPSRFVRQLQILFFDLAVNFASCKLSRPLPAAFSAIRLDRFREHCSRQQVSQDHLDFGSLRKGNSP
jgi:hypothetical protein